MQIIETIILTKSQTTAIFRLWNQEYPAKLKYNQLADFESYLESLNDKKHYLLIDSNNYISGWLFIFTRDTEKWFALIVDSSITRQGYGTKLLNIAKGKEGRLNGWVIDHNKDLKSDGTVYKSPLEFYLKNNFNLCSNVRIDTEKISAVKIVWTKPGSLSKTD